MKLLTILGLLSISVIARAGDITPSKLSAAIDTKAKWINQDNSAECKVNIERGSRNGELAVSVGDKDEYLTMTAEGLVEPDYNNAYDVTVNELEFQKKAVAGYSFGGKTYYMASITIGPNAKANKVILRSFRSLPLKFKFNGAGRLLDYKAVNETTCILAE